MGISTKAVPVETQNSIGMVERYHGPLRRAYQIIIVEVPDIDRDLTLQMALKAITDTAGPEGLVPTLLVFGAYPSMTELDAPLPTVAQRTNAMRKAITEIQKLRTQRQIADALNTPNGPRTDAIHDLPPNLPVLVWREGNDRQYGQAHKRTYSVPNYSGQTIPPRPTGPARIQPRTCATPERYRPTPV